MCFSNYLIFLTFISGLGEYSLAGVSQVGPAGKFLELPEGREPGGAGSCVLPLKSHHGPT